jgi:hypothetical protein
MTQPHPLIPPPLGASSGRMNANSNRVAQASAPAGDGSVPLPVRDRATTRGGTPLEPECQAEVRPGTAALPTGTRIARMNTNPITEVRRAGIFVEANLPTVQAPSGVTSWSSAMVATRKDDAAPTGLEMLWTNVLQRCRADRALVERHCRTAGATVAQASPPAGSGTVPVRVSGTGGETPLQPAVGDACATGITN